MKMTKEIQDITVERFRDWHYEVGEDFLDQTGEGNHLIFGGYLLAKYPHRSKEILKVCNDKYGGCQNYRELPELEFDEEKDIENLYVVFAEFCNLTEHLKKRVDRILTKGTNGEDCD